MRIFLFLLFLIPIFSFAQKNKVLMESVSPYSVAWNEGSILTTDEEELKGLVKYNSATGILYFEYGNDSRSMTSRNVVAFEFFDAKLNKQRLFYSLEFENRFHFFELLFDFKNFAVISKRDVADIDLKTNQAPYIDSYNTFPMNTTTTKVSQIETICFLSLDGEISPYIKIENIDKEGFWYDSSKSKKKLVEDDLLASQLGSDYEVIMDYVKENKLRVKNRDDLMQVFEYYATLQR